MYTNWPCWHKYFPKYFTNGFQTWIYMVTSDKLADINFWWLSPSRGGGMYKNWTWWLKTFKFKCVVTMDRMWVGGGCLFCFKKKCYICILYIIVASRHTFHIYIWPWPHIWYHFCCIMLLIWYLTIIDICDIKRMGHSIRGVAIWKDIRNRTVCSCT